METTDILQVVSAGVLSGGLSALGTIMGIKVHIEYLKERTNEITQRLTRLEDKVYKD